MSHTERAATKDRTGGPLADLLEAFDAAIARRAAPSWQSRERAQAAFDAAKSDMASFGSDPLIETTASLARHFGLGPTEVRLLTAAVGADVDPNLHLLSGLLSGDDGPARPTVALALELTELSPLAETTQSFLAEMGALRRHGLLRIEGSGALISRRLIVPDRVAAHMLGDSTSPKQLVHLWQDPAPVDLAGAETLAASVAEGNALTWVHSPPGAAGTSIAAAACRQLDVPVLVADLARLPGTDDPASSGPALAVVAAAVDALLLEAGLSGSVLILASAEIAAPVLGRLAYAALPVIAVGSLPWDPAWSPTQLPITVTAPRLTVTTRAALWWPILGTKEVPPEVAALRLTPENIVRVSRAASADAALANDPDVTVTHIRRATRRLGRNRSSRLTATAQPATLDDLVLPEHTFAEVVRLLDWARYRDDVLAQGPLQGKGGKGSGICALFSGSPGTGKSLAAHVVADTLGMDLYSVDISSMVDKYVGETEKNLERVFAEAESLNAVLFFDEADALFGSRSDVSDARDRYANQEVAYLLQRMEQFDGITILATNLRGNLDPAFSRRLHFMLHFPDPDEPTLRQLWKHHLAQLRGIDPDDPVDVPTLAQSLDVSGGDIRNIVLSAAYQAAAEHSNPAQALVGMRHIVAAAAREYTKLGRRIPIDGTISSSRPPNNEVTDHE